MTFDHDSGWGENSLAVLCSKIGSGATPRGGKSAYLEKGIALIRSQNVLDLSFNTKGLAKISDEAAEKLSGVSVEPGDVLLNITGDSVARCCVVPDWLGEARVNQHVMIIRPKPDLLDNRFLAQSLIAKKPKLLSLASAGATRPALTKSMVGDLLLRIPDIEEQRRISGVLTSLEKKIELNAQIAKTMEEICSETFRTGFSRMASDAPGRSNPSPEVPETVPLHEIFELTVGGVWGTEEKERETDVQVCVLRGIDLARLAAGEIPTPPLRWISPKQLEGRIPATNDLLVEASGFYCGRTLLYNEAFGSLFDRPVVYGNFVKRLRPKTKSLEEIQIASRLLKEIYRDGRITRFRKGSAVKNLDVSMLLNQVRMVVPNLDSAAGLVPIWTLANSPELRAESQTLTKVRDELLPKLVSGSVRVSEAYDPRPVLETSVLSVKAVESATSESLIEA